MPASSIYNAAMRNHRGLLIGVAALVIPITVLGVLMLLERRPAPVDWLEQGAVDERVNPDSFGLLRPGMAEQQIAELLGPAAGEVGRRGPFWSDPRLALVKEFGAAGT